MDIVTIVQNSGVKLKKQGSQYIGSCPFHNDKTPSFIVYPQTQSWHCFGNCSSKSGDVYSYVMQKYGYNFIKAKEFVEKGFFNVKLEIKDVPKVNKIIPHGMVIYWHEMLKDSNKVHYFYQRGFTQQTIDKEMFGWDGTRYVIPVWEGEPGNSSCLGVRKRKADDSNDNLPKYIGLKGSNHPTVWGRYHCKNHRLILAFAGELDACMAVQDGFPAFSIVGGINSINTFPKDWPKLWFPSSYEMIAIFDNKEESFGGKLCAAWNNFKGFGSSQVFHWDPNLDVKDYCNFRIDKGWSKNNFNTLLTDQIGMILI